MGGADWRDGGAGRYCAVGLAREAVSDGGGVGAGAAGWGWRRCEVALLGVGLAR